MDSMIERVARAIFFADCDFGYSIKLTGLVDGVSEYTLAYADGNEPMLFESYSEASEHTEARKNEVRARAAIEAMRDPDEAMTRALYDAGASNFAWQSAIDASLSPLPTVGV